jgi:hypothetical protein
MREALARPQAALHPVAQDPSRLMVVTARRLDQPTFAPARMAVKYMCLGSALLLPHEMSQALRRLDLSK